MALPALATVTELAAYLQRQVDPDGAELALQLASGKVRDYVNRPDHPAFVDDTTAPDGVKAIVLAVAGRVVTNPTDLRQEAVGSLSATYGMETIGVQLAEHERRDLRRYRLSARSIEMAHDEPEYPGIIDWAEVT